MGGLLSYLRTSPFEAIIYIVAFCFALTIHEFSHGLAAHLCGDDTAKNMGRLTMNPLSHLSLVGTLVMLFLPFGWAKPVPIVPRNFRNPKVDSLIVSAAGISANLLTAFVFGLTSRVIGWNNMNDPMQVLFVFFIMINIVFACFNLIPIPPLDGSKILAFFLPPSMAHKIEYMNPTWQFAFIGVIYLVMYLPGVHDGLFSVINIVFYSFSGVNLR